MSQPETNNLEVKNGLRTLKEVIGTAEKVAVKLTGISYGREMAPIETPGERDITWRCGPRYLVLAGENGVAIKLTEDEVDKLAAMLTRGLFPNEEAPVKSELGNSRTPDFFGYHTRKPKHDQERKS